MSMVDKRLIGVSDEMALERRTDVHELHIGWQLEEDRQYQRDPSGRTRIAPIIRWQQNGTLYRHVPTLSFIRNHSAEARLRRFLGLSEREEYSIDRDKLLADIESVLRRRAGVPVRQEPEAA